MEFKKCPRCGSFFHSDLNVCQNCQNNENMDIEKLKNYFEENANYSEYSTEDISVQTGISTRNLNRYFESSEFSEYLNNESLSNNF